jgi:hypothetical protein
MRPIMDTGTNGNTAYSNETPRDERVEIVKGDARKLPQPGEKGDTYLRRASSMIGAELGGRFQRLAEQSVVGQAPVPYPRLPGGPWAEVDPTGDEKPFPTDISKAPDVSKV